MGHFGHVEEVRQRRRHLGDCGVRRNLRQDQILVSPGMFDAQGWSVDASSTRVVNHLTKPGDKNRRPWRFGGEKDSGPRGYSDHFPVSARLIARQADMQFGYEDRIAELRAQIDRISSRQMLDQEQYEQKLDQIVRRQALLEQRSTALNALPDTTVTGAIKPPARNEPVRVAPSKPSPISDIGRPTLPQEREARVESRISSARLAMRSGGLETTLVRLTAALDRVLSDARMRQQMGQASRRRVEEYFAMERYVRRVLDEWRE